MVFGRSPVFRARRGERGQRKEHGAEDVQERKTPRSQDRGGGQFDLVQGGQVQVGVARSRNGRPKAQAADTCQERHGDAGADQGVVSMRWRAWDQS